MMAKDESRSAQVAILQIASIDPICSVELRLVADCLARVCNTDAVAAAVAAAPPTPSKIALISVQGGLTPRGSWFGTSLTGLAAQVRRAAADADVASIVLDIDSPGGTVSGTPEAAAAVREAAAQKPVVAIANTLAASAAYWIGSQASEFVMTPSADVGSIGAMILHQDVSGMLEQWGIRMTTIRSEQSPLKNETHPFAPLSEEAQAFLQQRANEAGADFIKAVASGRRVSQTKVREDFGQGRVFGAREAVERGMADRVATLDDVVASLAKKMGSRTRRRSALAFD
jgi:signal peptide peptidase SppA